MLQVTARALNFKAVVEPFRDFKIDLNVDRTITENYQEYFKKKSDADPFDHLAEQYSGSYTVSYIAIQTLFQKSDDQGFTAAFRQFQDVNRSVISNRLASGNPNSDYFFITLPDDDDNIDTLQNFREGYGPYSSEVLIPSFIAAYTNKDPNEVNMDPFKVFPLPNWRVTYNGLSNLPFMKKAVKTINITHGYQSTYTVNGYQSNLKFQGNGYYQPSSIEELSNNFVSYYNIPQVVITEAFSPLIGVDITWKNEMTTKFDFKKTRNLSMSVIDWQVAESKSTEFTFGFGYKLTGLVLPIKFKKKKVKLNNEIYFKCDVSYRDNVTFSQRLDQQVSEPTRGMKTIRVSPSIDYVINKNLRLKLFFDRNRTIPATSASYPITNTRAGVTISFTLAP